MSLRLRLLALILITILTTGFSAQAASQTEPTDRITGPILASARTKANDVHPLATKANDRGRVSASQMYNRMILLLQGSDTQKADLAQLLKDQQDPKSPAYHKWLSPTEFGRRFGPSQNDLAKVTGWLNSQGFTVEKPSNGRRFLTFTGTSSQVESAFQTEMHQYSVNGQSYFGNAKPASIPSGLARVVVGVAKLNSFNLPKPQYHLAKNPQGLSGGYIFTTPADLAAIYNSTPLAVAGFRGEGQSIALLEQSNIDPQDVIDFRNSTGLPAANLNVIVNGQDPGLIGDETEAIADVEYAGAFAPNATLNVVVSASTQLNSGIDLSTVYAVDFAVSPITSLSYGGCETLNALGSSAALYQYAWEQGAAEGISHFVSSGDNGADSCGFTGLDTGYGVNALGSTPFNVSVGGTEFLIPNITSSFPAPNFIAAGYVPESTWNDYQNPYDGRALAGGGGTSILYTKPYWQAGPGVPNDGARDLPDVSLVAGDNLAYLLCERDLGAVCSQGGGGGIIGTSLAAPSWASIQALVNQKNSIIGGVGNPNPTYYQLAAGSNSPFHDILLGDTKVPDPDGALIGYTATAGYDLATGLGSVDVNKLATSWLPPTGTGAATLSLTTDTVHIIHGSTLNAAVKLTAAGSTLPTGDLAFYAGPQGVIQAKLDNTGASSFSFSQMTGTVLPGGTYNLKAHYSGDAMFAPADSNLVPVTVDAEPTTAYSAPATQTVYYGSQVTLAAVAVGTNSNSVVGGTYTFQENGKTLGTASVPLTGESFAVLQQQLSAALTLGGAKSLAVGKHSISVTSPPSSASFLQSASAALAVTVLKAPVLVSLAPDHTSPALNTTVNLKANVLANYGAFVPVTGSVDFFDGTTKLGTATLGTAPQLIGEYFATLPVTFTTAGLHTIIAQYNGDANDIANISGAVDLTVGAKSSTTSMLSLTSSFVLAGNSVTLKATIAGDTANAAPTGTVTFTDTSATPVATVGTAAVASGVAALPVSSFTAGRHHIVATYMGDANFSGSVSGVQVVTVGDFTLIAAPAAVSVVAGQTSTGVTLAYSANYDLSAVGGNPTVSLACTGLPTGATCNFTNTSLTPAVGSGGGVTASSTLTISTTGPTFIKASLDPQTPLHRVAVMTFAGLLMFGLPFAYRKRRKFALVVGVMMLAFIGGLTGCGGPHGTYNLQAGGTPTGSATVTVTATVAGGTTIGTLAHAAPINLTVSSATGN